MQTEILQTIHESLEFHARNPRELPRRLAQLERDRYVERVIEANTSALGRFGLPIGDFGWSRSLLLSLAIQGRCPPRSDSSAGVSRAPRLWPSATPW